MRGTMFTAVEESDKLLAGDSPVTPKTGSESRKRKTWTTVISEMDVCQKTVWPQTAGELGAYILTSFSMHHLQLPSTFVLFSHCFDMVWAVLFDEYYVKVEPVKDFPFLLFSVFNFYASPSPIILSLILFGVSSWCHPLKFFYFLHLLLGFLHSLACLHRFLPQSFLPWSRWISLTMFSTFLQCGFYILTCHTGP